MTGRISVRAKIAPGVVIPEHAVLRARAVVNKPEDVLVIGPLFDGYFTAHRDADIGIRLVRPCYSGTIEGYEATLDQRCAGQPHKLEAYRTAIAWIKMHFELHQ